MKKGVVIVAGGSGSRMGTSLPKQYLDLCGEPIIVRTIKKFLEFDPDLELVLVIPASDESRWKEIQSKFLEKENIQTCAGGKTRFHSVKNGLDKIIRAKFVGIHDAVRPLVSNRTLEFCFSALEEHDAVVPVYPMKSSLRQIKGKSSRAMDRSSIVAVQTPQCFRAEVLEESFKQSYTDQFTDDATVAESAGYEVHCVDGNEENIKITTPYDLMIAEVLVNSGF